MSWGAPTPYGYSGYGAVYGDATEPDTMSMASDALVVLRSIFGPKSSAAVRAQLDAARARGASIAKVRELEAQLHDASRAEMWGTTWKVLGGLALVGVIGVAAASSYALVARSPR